MKNSTEIKDSKIKYKHNFDHILREYLVRDLRPYFSGGDAIELGCYHGDFTKNIAKHFNNIYAVDASIAAINTLKNNASENNIDNIIYINQFFEDLELPVKVDHIFMVHSYEHIKNRKELLESLKNYLNDSGRLFIVVPNAYAASRQIAACMGIIDYNHAVTESEKVHGHYSTFSLDILNFELRQAGFKVIKNGGVMFKPLANYQFDLCLQHQIIDKEFIEGCYLLGNIYPELAASIYSICEL
ncbi:class I SAM-dependent methyltransferase [Piscirickettsia salmonis]|uniref:class I SAM-dependent methyltransferase n=1 Tax=Piscirickettsia salmonis TaxID=1238 RepID=UPI0002FACD8F|nr:class I SAM-dependent methyltransferase [Piscirickettsia salmonis]APS56427.1 hypothetical protein AVI52_03735 [Piscirickettsia salmonis]ERL61659.1 hypothetical protein K661_01990 [Piscirickettsia salmonis LF-89 = ATCC VR-1361]PEQ15770.1 class I SAM-dependent methyltransferase [Piscirickettsia salmonis]QGN77747.1 bifunctional 3-demethylubiquinone-9 3-methyltransferase/ 2-octaprenyl-6-hydroxy phenol methylase [Piscirickettsia salmonis]QGN81334.1 bifunctional 3-demethylubiquinone-9 3-methyltra